MNREIYNKIREFSVDMYTQGFSDGYTDGSTRGCEVEKSNQYKKGFQEGYSQGRKETYEKGLKDAWEAARKIIEMGEYERKYNVFTKCDDGEYPFVKYTAAEAIYNIKEYEKRKKCEKCIHKDDDFDCHNFCVPCDFDHFKEKQDNQTELSCTEDDDEIRVGDEVIFDNNKYKVIGMPYGGCLKVLSEDDRWEMICDKDNVSKTGRNFSSNTEND